MPTSTFFRLPEEKRVRLLDACWAECTRAGFADISINRIISAARIPRGSFYQYFSDRDEMIRYLLQEIRSYFIGLLRDILVEARGDLFVLPAAAFDRFFSQDSLDPMLARFIQVMRLNLGIDLQSMMTTQPGFLPDPLWKETDTALLRQKERTYADHVFHLLVATLAYAVAGTLKDGGRREQEREALEFRVALLRYGCAAAPDGSRKEVTA